jgi:hypothetical protein
MANMDRPIRTAFILALPIEVVNYFLLAIPFNEGFPSSVNGIQGFLNMQWAVLHLVGIRLIGWLDPYDAVHIGRAIVFVAGYLNTTLVLIMLFFLFGWIGGLLFRK